MKTKMICINNKVSPDYNASEYFFITIGKEYYCVYESDKHPYVEIINDIGTHDLYLKENFITMEEYRNQKLRELGI